MPADSLRVLDPGGKIPPESYGMPWQWCESGQAGRGWRNPEATAIRWGKLLAGYSGYAISEPSRARVVADA